MSAVYVSNLVINSGADFAETFDLESSITNSQIDLTGYSVFSQMRKYAGSSTAISFTTTVLYPQTSGKIKISLTSEQTSSIKPGRYVYDVIIVYGGVKTRVIEGMVLVREGVTQ